MIFVTTKIGSVAHNLEIIQFEMCVYIYMTKIMQYYLLMFLLLNLKPVRRFWLLTGYEGISRTKIGNIFFNFFMEIRAKNWP